MIICYCMKCTRFEMYFVDGMDLSFVFQSVFPYYTNGFRLKNIDRSELDGYDAEKELLSKPMDYNMVYGKLVNDSGQELGSFQSVNGSTKVLFDSDFIFSQINEVNKTVNHYYLTFAFYLKDDFTFKSFSFDFLYDFYPVDKYTTSKFRYSHHVELILDDFIKITTDDVDYDLNGPATMFEILPDFVLACVYNSNKNIDQSDKFDLELILQGQKIEDKKRFKELLGMISY